MLDPKKVRVGIAPIAWTEDDMPEMGAENSFLQTISEIALTGYVGTEIGCQFPRDPAILNKELGRRDLSVITAWISTYLNEQGYNPELIEVALSHMNQDRIRMAYNRADYLKQRFQILQAWADFVDECSQGALPQYHLKKVA